MSVNGMKPGIILSMEQALSMTYATLRFVHLGWRVIKLEATPVRSGALPGDPNRYIGTKVADEGRRSYFIGPNLGKEAISLNLKSAAGREALKRIIKELDVDVFCCNTLPGRYEELDIDYDNLRSVKPNLIWAGISAMGPDFPYAAGYDPAIQAMAGYMELTGQADGPPTLSGVPAGRPQGRRRGLCQCLDGDGQAGGDRRRHAHRRFDAAGRRIVADYRVAADRFRL